MLSLPCGLARVVSSPLMEVEAVDFDGGGARFELAPGEVGRLIAAGLADEARSGVQRICARAASTAS